MNGGAATLLQRQAEAGAQHADEGKVQARRQGADRVVRLVDELAASLGVDAIDVAPGADAAAERGARLDEMHAHAAPRQLVGRAEPGEATAGDDDTHVTQGGHTSAGAADPACVRRWEPRRTRRPGPRRPREA